jgi:CRISPR-associated protein Cmr2
MSFLMDISVGPVQEFIAAARRTGDLASGSSLLQDICKEIVVFLNDNGAELIFPSDVNESAANKILVEIDHNPEEIAAGCREKANEYLLKRWGNVEGQLQQRRVSFMAEIARSQVDSFLEFYAAWTPLTKEYEADRRRVESLLAGRKALRNFTCSVSEHGHRKSLLDPAFDAVLMEGEQSKLSGNPFFLKETENLDAISLIKRSLHITGTPSVPAMALRSYEAIFEREKSTDYDFLQTIAKNAGVSLCDIFYENRLNDAIEESPAEKSEYLRSLREEILGHSRSLRKLAAEDALSYYAVLAADGDRMGDMLNNMDREEHVQFSRSLGQFSGEAKRIVKACNGYAVYAGGDDVLALLPVNRAIECAVKLRTAFGKAIKNGELSVGVAVAHMMEPLQGALNQARDAESTAKRDGRNRLAVSICTRGSEGITGISCWEDDPVGESWMQLIEAFRNGLSRGLPYELRELAREMENTELPEDVVQNEAIRVINRKEGKEKLGDENERRNWVVEQKLKKPDDLARLADRLYIARFLSLYPLHKEEINA